MDTINRCPINRRSVHGNSAKRKKDRESGGIKTRILANSAPILTFESTSLELMGIVGDMKKMERHGMRNTPEYMTWNQIIQRCHNPARNGYKHYGGRGIKVCERWRASFTAFFADMGNRPSDNHSIDRINNDGDYEPGNCRWATSVEQQNNQSRCRYVTIGGVRKTIKEWSNEIGVPYTTMVNRLNRGVGLERFTQKRLKRASGEARLKIRKLTDGQIEQIRQKYIPGNAVSVAAEFGVSRSLVTIIGQGKYKRNPIK